MNGRVHMVGIGGIGMSAVAQILLARGCAVSGSDAHASTMTARLAELGAEITIGHRAELVEGAARVVISDAIRADNPELRRARELGLRVQRRSELLAELMAGSRGLAVSGTHGKTTVTAMTAAALVAAGMDPTVALGGSYGPLGGNARAGRGEWFVVEACEAYDSFLDLRPDIAVITNIEAEHLDHHRTEQHLHESFTRFVGAVAEGGCLVVCADRPELSGMRPPAGRDVVTYGFAEHADVRGVEPRLEGTRGRCRLLVAGEEAGELTVNIPGVHNLSNALGALAAARRAGAGLEACRRALSEFRGVERRFQVLGEARGITVVDDYAHHPTEVAATLAAARAAFPGRRLVAVFQPHLYSRTRDFASGFARALAGADVVVLVGIYAARESPIEGVTTQLIAGPLRRDLGEDVVFEMEKGDVASKLPAIARARDVIVVMGAGDIGEAAHALVHSLGAKSAGEQQLAAKT